MMQHAIPSAGETLPVRPLRATKRRRAMPDLLTRIATDRSEEAFGELYREIGPRVRDYMRRQGADATTAEDLAQETLAAVWRKAALYAPEKGSPTAWIFAIARNLRIDRLRRETAWQELTEEQAGAIPSEDTPPDLLASERQRQARVRDVLAELPPEQVQVVTLAFMEGMPHSEIAERLALPLGTVKSRIRLAYQKLRTALEDLR
jgi:RNA polymerase sigma-70 factor (ECF subfamily)